MGFQKVSLEPGQSQTVSFTVKVPSLAFFDQSAGKWSVDVGRYGIAVGSSSAASDLPLRSFVTVKGTIKPTPSVLTVKPTMEGDAAHDIADRVFFPAKVAVLANPTVAMNDDTLYGYVTKGSSKPFPTGMAFTYTSNRPGVVSVKKGVIRTVGAGVATVTATVSYAGVKKSTSFVVDATP